MELMSLQVVVTGSKGLHLGLTGALRKAISLALKSSRTSRGISALS